MKRFVLGVAAVVVLAAMGTARAHAGSELEGKWYTDTIENGQFVAIKMEFKANGEFTAELTDLKGDSLGTVSGEYTYANNSVRIDWLNGPKESVTVFAEFVGSAMAQQQNGDKPRRPFHRC